VSPLSRLFSCLPLPQVPKQVRGRLPSHPATALVNPQSIASDVQARHPLSGEGHALLSKASRPNPNLIKPDKAKELFKKIDPEQFKDAQLDMEQLKKKYSKLPYTRYPKEGTKRNSLQDIPFTKRLYFGGNVGLTSTDPLILSSNLQLGYWINKKWLAGVGITLREQFTAEDTTSLVSGDGFVLKRNKPWYFRMAQKKRFTTRRSFF